MCLSVYTVRYRGGHVQPRRPRPWGPVVDVERFLPACAAPRHAGTGAKQLTVTHHREPDCRQPVANSNIHSGSCEDSAPGTHDSRSQRLKEDTVCHCMSSVLQIDPFAGTCGEGTSINPVPPLIISPEQALHLDQDRVASRPTGHLQPSSSRNTACTPRGSQAPRTRTPSAC